jgi:hypothetical protein
MAGQAVEVRFPVREQTEEDREVWPWLSGQVLSVVGRGEWLVHVTDKRAVRQHRDVEPYAYRTSGEIRARSSPRV